MSFHGLILFEPELTGLKIKKNGPSPVENMASEVLCPSSPSLSQPLLCEPRGVTMFRYSVEWEGRGAHQLVEQQEGLVLNAEGLPTSPHKHGTNDPLLLQWTAMEWNSDPYSLSLAHETTLAYQSKPHLYSTLVSMVYDRIFKALKYQRPSHDPAVCDSSTCNNGSDDGVSDDGDVSKLADPLSCNGEAGKKKHLNKKFDRKKVVNPFEDIPVQKKYRASKSLSLLYNTPLPKARISRLLKAKTPSPTLDSDIIKRKKQFIREHVSFSKTVEEEAIKALQIGMSLKLTPINNEQEAIDGLSESITRRRAFISKLID